VVTPPLTTVEWGMGDVATAAAGMLADAVGGRPRTRARVRVAPALVARASTAALALA
jgi:LacI family transcriptional regulator